MALSRDSLRSDIDIDKLIEPLSLVGGDVLVGGLLPNDCCHEMVQPTESRHERRRG